MSTTPKLSLVTGQVVMALTQGTADPDLLADGADYGPCGARLLSVISLLFLVLSLLIRVLRCDTVSHDRASRSSFLELSLTHSLTALKFSLAL